MRVADKGNVTICSHMVADSNSGIITVQAEEGTVVMGPAPDGSGLYMYIQDAAGSRAVLSEMALQHIVQASLLVLGAEADMMDEAMDVLGMGKDGTHAKAIVVPDSTPNEQRVVIGREIEAAIQEILEKHGMGGARVK